MTGRIQLRYTWWCSRVRAVEHDCERSYVHTYNNNATSDVTNNITNIVANNIHIQHKHRANATVMWWRRSHLWLFRIPILPRPIHSADE